MSDRPSRRRSLLVLVVVALVAVSVAATWVASDRIRSPAEVAARTLAPEPSPILVPVEQRVLSSDVVTRGTGRFGSPQTLSAAVSALRSSPGFVDAVPEAGTALAEGDVALTASGRPLIVLRGDQPSHRDLGPGMFGNDVLQLEQALERLGFSPGDVDGDYDLLTQFAVGQWYRSLGYPPVMMTAAQRGEIRAIEAAIDAIDRDVLAASETLAAARAELVAAREAHRQAMESATAADDDVERAGAQAEAENAVANGEVASARATFDRALADLPPPWATQEEQIAALADLDGLRLALEIARAAADATRIAGASAVRDAELIAEAAPGEVRSAADAVAVAEERVAIAVEAVELAGAPSAILERDLELARERSGIQVPADEILFLSDTPVRVAEVLVQRGDRAEGPLLSVTDTAIAIDGALALEQAPLVEVGMVVEIEELDLGIAGTGTVSAVADRPGTRGADGFHIWFETVVADASLANVVGASVRLTIPVETTGGLELTVPASALTLAADGTSQILVDRSGTLETVVVEPGLSAEGYVAIGTAVAEVAPGDLVVVGFEPRRAPSDSVPSAGTGG